MAGDDQQLEAARLEEVRRRFGQLTEALRVEARRRAGGYLYVIDNESGRFGPDPYSVDVPPQAIAGCWKASQFFLKKNKIGIFSKFIKIREPKSPSSVFGYSILLTAGIKSLELLIKNSFFF